MVKDYKQANIDPRPYPTQQEDVPNPYIQKELIVEKLKEQREALEKVNLDLRQKQTLRSTEGPKVSKASLLKIMRDVDNQDLQKAIYGLSEEQLIVRHNTENWIKQRKNAGMQVLEKLKDMEFAK